MIVSCPSCQRNYVVADEQIAGKQFRARCKSCGVEFRLDGMPSRDAGAEGTAGAEPAKFMSATEAFLALQTAPPPSNANWSVCLSQTDTRRMSTAEVVQAVAKGTINTGMFVWKNGMANWVRLSEVPELMAALGKGGASRSSPPTAHPAPSIVPGTSKSAPPMRQGSIAPSPQPPVPGSNSSLPPRSGQTMPPPPLHADAPQPPPVPRQTSARPGATETDSPVVTEKPPAPGILRRNTPSPPRRATLDIPVEIDMSPPEAPVVAPSVAPVAPTAPTQVAPSPAEVSVPTAGGVLLPPLKGAEAAGAPTAAAAAIVAAAAAQSRSTPAPAPEPKPEIGAVDSTARTSSRPSDLPEPRRKSKGFAGALVAMASVGLVGVIGGVAGAIYVMKSAASTAPQSSATTVAALALPPQAATPASVAAPSAAMMEAPTPAAPPPTAGDDVLDGDSSAVAPQDAQKAKSSGRTPPAGAAVTRSAATPTPTPKAPEPKSEPAAVPNLPPPAAESQTGTPPKSGAGSKPFNRDAAMAVLGFAASRASSCKKADGPTGTAKVYVTFDPNGTVVIANVVGSPIAGTPVAQCIAGIFRRIKVPPFAGDRASLSKDVSIRP